MDTQSSTGAANTNSKVKVVAHVDLTRYVGVWYEIASIPVWFQKDCAGNVMATYTILPDGTVNVLNQCSTSDGKIRKAEGRAWVVDKKTNAKLKVSFAPFGLRLFAGDYWIIDLGADYEYAVVGHPSRTYGWILSRTKTLPPDALNGIKMRLEQNGYDFSKFKMTIQK